ncbi:MAG: hypothetical protein JRI68_22100 [Deltaproteobacteria bacterium]|nr:hypothetical protein [Deltaproteobacteria bacterium]
MAKGSNPHDGKQAADGQSLHWGTVVAGESFGMPQIIIFDARGELVRQDGTATVAEGQATLREDQLDREHTTAVVYPVRMGGGGEEAAILWGLLGLAVVAGLGAGLAFTFVEEGGAHPHRELGILILIGVVVLLALVWLVRGLRWVRLRFAGDGLLLQRPWGDRFIHAADVATLRSWRPAGRHAPPEGFDIVLASGRRIPIHTERVRNRIGQRTSGDFVLDALTERLGTDSPLGSPAAVERGDDSVEAWLERLRGLWKQSAGYRERAPVDVRQLWAILQHPKAVPSARVACAVALRAWEGEETDDALRRLVGVTVNPDLVAAFRGVDDGDDPRLMRALATLG